MSLEKKEIYRSIAEMAYVVAKADKGLSRQEKVTFDTIIEAELGLDSWAAQSRFELLDEVINPSIDEAYNDAIRDFKKYRTQLTPELIELTLRVLNKVAESCSGSSATENLIIDRVKRELNNLIQE